MSDAPLFDHAARVRDAAIDAVEANRRDLVEAGVRAAGEVAASSAEFTSLDVRRVMEKRGYSLASEPRILGAIMRAASLREVIRRTDRTAVSDSTTAHKRPVRVWEPFRAARRAPEVVWCVREKKSRRLVAVGVDLRSATIQAAAEEDVPFHAIERFGHYEVHREVLAAP